MAWISTLSHSTSFSTSPLCASRVFSLHWRASTPPGFGYRGPGRRSRNTIFFQQAETSLFSLNQPSKHVWLESSRGTVLQRFHGSGPGGTAGISKALALYTIHCIIGLGHIQADGQGWELSSAELSPLAFWVDICFFNHGLPLDWRCFCLTALGRLL